MDSVDNFTIEYNNRAFGAPPKDRNNIPFNASKPMHITYNDETTETCILNVNNLKHAYYVEPIVSPPKHLQDMARGLQPFEFVIPHTMDFFAIVGKPLIRISANDNVIYDGANTRASSDLIIIPIRYLTHTRIGVRGNTDRTDGVQGSGLFGGIFGLDLLQLFQPDFMYGSFGLKEITHMIIPNFAIMKCRFITPLNYIDY